VGNVLERYVCGVLKCGNMSERYVCGVLKCDNVSDRYLCSMLKCGQRPEEVCVWHVLKNTQGDVVLRIQSKT